MRKLVTLIILISVQVFQTQGQKSSLLWREDGRCGDKYPLPNGNPGQCDPEGNGPKKGPCCSPKGFCGNTSKHCECATCVDYSKIKDEKDEKDEKNDKPESKEKLTKTKPESKPVSKADDTEIMKSAELVETRSGSIKGLKIMSEDGLTHYQFHGIPYAQSPVGRLRFKAPLPIRPWTKILDASKKGPYCYQKTDFQPATLTEMSEDCLHLSIYTEDLETKFKPVMIWIHGGGFTQGSGNEYTPENLIREGVIVVTINYRLGSLGFLTFGNDIVSGNMGLKDQALAIQWVKQNIENFGGNPNKITIFGESAGGMSVHAQVLSPWNYGQIQGAIAQSGTMLLYNNIKSVGKREERFAEKVAELLECPIPIPEPNANVQYDLDQSLLECLQSVDIELLNEKLALTIDEYFESNTASPFEWRPVIDNYASNPFLPMEPLEAMKTGTFNRIPFISGTVKNEGALMVGLFNIQNISREILIENWGSFGAPLILNTPSEKNFTKEEKMLASISLKYYNHPVGDAGVALDQPLMDLFTDAGFVSPDQKTVQLMSKYTPNVFNYYLTQQTDNSLIGKLFKLGKEYTPVHADDLLFLMDVYGQKTPDSESPLSKHMVKYWTNFAKFGHPSPSAQDTPVWSPVTGTEKNYIELKAEPEMRQNLLPERMQFWEKMMWAEKEDVIERKQMYIQATQFLLDQRK